MPGRSAVAHAVHAEPAPRRGPLGLPPQLEQAFQRALHSELSLLRIVATVAGVSYFLFLGISRSNALRLVQGTLPLNPWIIGALIVMAVSAAFVVSAAVVHVRRYYYAVFRGSFVAFSLLVVVHVAFRVTTGESPLQDIYLGDYAGVPGALVVAATPVGPGTLAALATLSFATVFNDTSAPESLFYLAVELGHAWLLMGPFLFMIARGRQISRRLDAAAAAEYRTAVTTARSALLQELENRFLSHVHDHVLADLRAVAAGTLPPAELDRSMRFTVPDSRPVAVVDVIATLREMAGEAAVRADFDAPADVDPGAVIPSDAAAAIEDCMHEALSNSARHAPGAPRRLTVDWDGRLSVTASDDGPGFDPARVPTDRAGVRVSILHRPRSVPGLDVDLATAPAAGTSVRAVWDGCAAEAETARPSVPRHPVPSAQETLGINTLFRPANAAVAFTVFVGLGLVNDHSGAWGYFVAGLALTAAALALLCRVDGVRLDASAAWGVAVCTFAMVTLGQFAPFPTAEMWPFRWYVPVGLLLCSYLALRSRPLFAWGTWLAAGVATAAVQATDLSARAPEAASAEWLFNQAPLLVPASFIPVLLGGLLRSLPLLERASRDEFVNLDLTTARRNFLDDWTRWLLRQLRVVVEDGSPECAATMEKRLRDAIRSPVLDVPAVTAAVWEARSRGARVRLIDDRSPAAPEPGPQRELEGLVVATAAELAEGDAMTVRLPPEGRRTYATVVAESGEDRTRRVSVPATR